MVKNHQSPFSHVAYRSKEAGIQKAEDELQKGKLVSQQVNTYLRRKQRSSALRQGAAEGRQQSKSREAPNRNGGVRLLAM